MKKNIGITSRITRNEYGSDCDALERSYVKYFNGLGLSSVIIPNEIDQIDNLLNDLNLRGVVLSGGGDISSKYQNKLLTHDMVDSQFDRDIVEDTVLKWTIKNRVPVLGICRGMQMINAFFGGKLTTDLKNSTIGVNHAGVEHMVKIVDNRFCPMQTIKVNSFHNHGVVLDGLGSSLLPLAVTLDGLLVEGLHHPDFLIVAVQWHPERKDFSDTSNLIVSQLFN